MDDGQTNCQLSTNVLINPNKGQEMLDTTSYTDKLPSSLNLVLKELSGSECVMVRKIKEKDKDKSINLKNGNCHLNVKAYVEAYGGKAVFGWLLNRQPEINEVGMYTWSFHSVWMKSDGRLVDLTEDSHYTGRDKTIFVPDTTRSFDFEEGKSHNNFAVFSCRKFAAHYGASIGKILNANQVYWCDSSVLHLLGMDEHSGVYRLLVDSYPKNREMMCEEYGLEFVNGKMVLGKGGKFKSHDAVPIKMIFDYGVRFRS